MTGTPKSGSATPPGSGCDTFMYTYGGTITTTFTDNTTCVLPYDFRVYKDGLGSDDNNCARTQPYKFGIEGTADTVTEGSVYMADGTHYEMGTDFTASVVFTPQRAGCSSHPTSYTKTAQFTPGHASGINQVVSAVNYHSTKTECSSGNDNGWAYIYTGTITTIYADSRPNCEQSSVVTYHLGGDGTPPPTEYTEPVLTYQWVGDVDADEVMIGFFQKNPEAYGEIYAVEVFLTSGGSEVFTYLGTSLQHDYFPNGKYTKTYTRPPGLTIPIQPGYNGTGTDENGTYWLIDQTFGVKKFTRINIYTEFSHNLDCLPIQMYSTNQDGTSGYINVQATRVETLPATGCVLPDWKYVLDGYANPNYPSAYEPYVVR